MDHTCGQWSGEGNGMRLARLAGGSGRGQRIDGFSVGGTYDDLQRSATNPRVPGPRGHVLRKSYVVIRFP